MTGNSLELKIRHINWKLLIIGRVMTSLIVITLEIGQSAGKEPNFDMSRIWFSLNDRTGMGLRSLINFYESLRYSLTFCESKEMSYEATRRRQNAVRL